jgi:CRISPR-associated protein Csm5
MNNSIRVEGITNELMLTGLSPIFIGSGKKYSELNYIYEKNKIYIIDFDKLLDEVPFDLIDDLTKTISDNFENNIWTGDVKEFLSRYVNNWRNFISKEYDLIGKIGKNEINRFIKSGETIYIPGSSLKGAIRTSILFKILKENPREKDKILDNLLSLRYFKDRKIQNLINTNAKTDVLRALIVSDLKLENQNRNIQIAESNVYHLRDKKSTIPVFNEILNMNFKANGSVKIDKSLLESTYIFSRYFKLNISNIIKAINDFSSEIIKHEIDTFQKLNDQNLENVIKFYQNLREISNQLKDDECIIRVGQGSSFLGITMFLIFKNNIEMLKKYMRLEIINFNTRDRYNENYAIARDGQFTILVDRNSRLRPRLNEKWLCKIVRIIKRSKKFVTLLKKADDNLDLRNIIFPLTRKFIASDSKILYPFGWIKIKWS